MVCHEINSSLENLVHRLAASLWRARSPEARG
jgi:hypothetical protein